MELKQAYLDAKKKIEIHVNVFPNKLFSMNLLKTPRIYGFQKSFCTKINLRDSSFYKSLVMPFNLYRWGLKH